MKCIYRVQKNSPVRRSFNVNSNCTVVLTFMALVYALKLIDCFKFLKGSLSKLSPLSIFVFAVVVVVCKSYIKIKEISITIYSRFPGG